ncbi:MAG: ParB/RepB/Spo0J family partition protein [Oscillospiraceae bacterium]|nr:ParB/RepB/Spo0J family partition protein [Oscillospiraceae bacterium]
MAMKTPTMLTSRKVILLPVGSIHPNPMQPRKIFDPDALGELTESIRMYGVLQPLTVRKAGDGSFELVAGERRLRASRAAGLDKVPCILVNVSEQDSGLLALVENLQRQDLDFIEEAEGLRALTRSYGMSQEEAARCIGLSQSAVANKLRLLRLSPELLYLLRERGLSERHARALLRLENDEQRLEVLSYVLEHDLNVARTEQYIEDYLKRGGPPKEAQGKKKAPRIVLKDVRIFFNTVTKGLGVMRRSGVQAEYDQAETEADYILTIRIPKAGNCRLT